MGYSSAWNQNILGPSDRDILGPSDRDILGVGVGYGRASGRCILRVGVF